MRELAWVFLKIGALSFGGPAAHTAMMEEECVRRRRWLSRERFLDLLGAANLIPGPNSTELAIHIGYHRAGWPGLLAAGVCFILPATLIVTAVAWAYVRYGSLPEARSALYGIGPVVIAIVVQALAGLARTAMKARFRAMVAVASVLATLAGAHELLVLLGAGMTVALSRSIGRSAAGGGLPALAAPALAALAAAGPAAPVPFGTGPLFLFFLKVGSVLFGSGYVLLAFLRADLVGRFGWLTEAQLLDAIAVGQFTPGPLFTTATFIGYFLGGPPAAFAATAGIFLPAFVFVALSGPLVPRIRCSATAGAFLDGVNAASLALIAVVTWRLGVAAIVDPLTVSLAAASAVLLLRFRVGSAWLVAGGALVGIVAHALR
jgi:chromate transporter